MKIRETIKNDWRVDVGFLFSIILVLIFILCLFGKISFLYFFLVYIFGFLFAIFTGITEETALPFAFPFFLLFFLVANKQEKDIKKYLEKFNSNTHKKAVVILAYYDKYTIKYSFKNNYSLEEIKALVEYLKISRGDDFSFYLKASKDDVVKIIEDENVREVLFVGHGDSHTFVLNLDEEIYYCDFNNTKCSKDFIHQAHCGDKFGKSLVEYVVSKDNQNKCFYSRKEVSSKDIIKWFKNRTEEIKNNLNKA